MEVISHEMENIIRTDNIESTGYSQILYMAYLVSFRQFSQPPDQQNKELAFTQRSFKSWIWTGMESFVS